MSNEVTIGSKVMIAGCACVIFSSLTPEELRQFKIHHPEALKMTDDNGSVIFSVDLEDDEPGYLLPDAAAYSTVTSTAGKATITILLDTKIDNPVEAVKNQLGQPLMRLIELEEQLVQLLPRLKEETKAVEAQITCL